ncbi:MAG: 3-ketoacyl-CoA thiolase [Bacteroidetes bacterium GWF2_49_14]|nr:MAG: 3-ketoacyl-CoA thiolase [Bacteroidetes bacterium GWF2_49_14]HBB90711.1 3-ketoacyl-CoA thiolase [Bacteroidales bacterium]
MSNLRRKVYMTGGYNTISLGTGRKEFNPKKVRPGLELYIKEAGNGTLAQIGGAVTVDECVIGNFMASRFNRQAHLGGFIPMIDEALRYKPATRVEGACASGGLALTAGIRAVLAESAEVVLALGVEVQNSVKAIYGADILAGAGWYPDRKAGHAYFFPGQFSNRAGAYFDRYGRETARQGMARWFRNMIENARLCPTAQEYHNSTGDLDALGLSEPDGRSFVDHLNVFDCSKVSDGASAIAILSEEGLKRAGIPREQAVEVVAWAQVEEDITKPPADLTVVSTIKEAVRQVLERAGITIDQVGTVETHDCFTIAAVLAIEAMGLAKPGHGGEFILAGHTSRMGRIPFNTTGGLIGWGHPTGATGVHQAVTIWEQLTGRAGDSQIRIHSDRPFGLTVNMGGDDKTVVAILYKKP